MKYQIIEKPIYSEADLLHFGDEIVFGDSINNHFPDYSGIQLGLAIFEREDKEKITELKNQLEVKRLRTLKGVVNAFFNDDEKAETFFASVNFSKLQTFYQEEFGLKLLQRTANQMIVGNDDFHIPAIAREEQVLQIQKLLDLYFFELKIEKK